MTFRFFEKAHVWLSAVFLWLAKDLEEPLKIFFTHVEVEIFFF